MLEAVAETVRLTLESVDGMRGGRPPPSAACPRSPLAVYPQRLPNNLFQTPCAHNRFAGAETGCCAAPARPGRDGLRAQAADGTQQLLH